MKPIDAPVEKLNRKFVFDFPPDSVIQECVGDSELNRHSIRSSDVLVKEVGHGVPHSRHYQFHDDAAGQ